MKCISIILALGAALTTISVQAAQECQRYLQGHIDKSLAITEEDLRDRAWISALDSNIDAAGALERERKKEGKTVSPEELTAVLGGSLVYLRKTTLPSGLVFVTIHRTEDGSEIFDDKMYDGLFTCNCGAIHDAPAVTTASIIHNTPLGHGFILQWVTSGSGGTAPPFTESVIIKKYGNPEVNTTNEVVYHIAPKPGSTEIDSLFVEYKQRSFQTSKDTKNQGRGPLEPKNQKILVAETMAAVRIYSGKLFEAEIQVSYNLLAASKWDSAYDQIKLSFDSEGHLAHILGVSQSQLPNFAWGTEADFLQALQKGNNKPFSYNPNDPRAPLIFRTVFGRDIDRH
jgi:hypothetical protein